MDIKNLLVKLSSIKKDKLLHFFYSFFIVLGLKFILNSLSIIIIVFSLSILKELYDKYNNGSVEVLDIVFTLLPLLMLI